MKKRSKGNYLKEVGFSFLLPKKLSIETAQEFIRELTKKIKVELISITVNNLKPGFDLLCGIKESCIYLGYWQEVDLVRLIVSSCKNYNERSILIFISDYFPVKRVKYSVISDKSIDEEVKECLL